MKAQPVLIRVLRDPALSSGLSLQEWNLLVRQARRSILLASLARQLHDNGLYAEVPARARWHFDAALDLAAKQHHDVRWEVDCIQRALNGTGIPFILLKGAAYVMADLAAASGRLFSDVDILVAEEDIGDAEQALMIAGWQGTHQNKYDQRYYRRWMHEIPPMQHMRRLSVIDVHHNIVPKTSRYAIDAQPLREKAECLREAGNPAESSVSVLSPEDRVIHSAVHLFCDGEFDHGLRDLVDLSRLIGEGVAKDASFGGRLVARAAELGLERPLFYGLRYVGRVLQHCGDVVAVAGKSGRPAGPVLWFMDQMFERALVPPHESCKVRLGGFATWFLYMRAHYLRMPLYLLIPHLLRKAFKGDDGEE